MVELPPPAERDRVWRTVRSLAAARVPSNHPGQGVCRFNEFTGKWIAADYFAL